MSDKLAKIKAKYASVSWKQMPGKLVQVSTSKYGTWGVSKDDKIWRFLPGYKEWEQVKGELTCVSIGNDGTVWGCNRAGAIWRYTGNGWEKMPGELKQLCVAHANSVLGVNSKNEIWHWNGSKWTKQPGEAIWVACNKKNDWYAVGPNRSIWYCKGDGKWQKIDGILDNISVNSSGVVTGCNKENDSIWCRDGPNGSWVRLPGAAVQVSGGHKKALVCVNRGDDIWAM